MFTRNWYKFLAKMIESNNKSIDVKNLKNATKQIPRGSQPYIMFGFDNISYTNYATLLRLVASDILTTKELGVFLGDGNTPAKYDDFTLSGKQIKTFTYTSVLTITPTEDSVTYEVLYTITNTGEEPITIKEIGFVGSCIAGSSYRNEDLCLLERTVLDEPITIQPQGVGQVTYTITFNFPTPA